MQETPKIRVLVVDDSSVMRRIIATALTKNAALEVVGYAANGLQAIDRVRELQPDVVTLDIEMPELDGLSALREIRKHNQSVAIIMFSTLTHRGAQATVMALTAGATDYVCKPSAALGSMGQAFQVLESELIPKIIGLAQRAMRRKTPRDVPTVPKAAPAVSLPVPTAAPATERSAGWRPSQLPAPATAVPASERTAGWRPSQLLAPGTSPVAAVVIGVSTGGPMALKQLFGALSAPLPVPVFIVQHMPATFTTLLAARLTAAGVVTVKEPVDGELPRGGVAYMAPGGQHLVLSGNAARVSMGLTADAPRNSCRPSVDVLFESAAQVYGEAVLALVLTGMGSDGLRGCQQIKARKGQVIVQDEESSVVWGMPGAVAQNGLADRVLPLDKIAEELSYRTRRRTSLPSLP
jgi:two-component system chemotaxis response regulator CheB